jgi:hypothetical protein
VYIISKRRFSMSFILTNVTSNEILNFEGDDRQPTFSVQPNRTYTIEPQYVISNEALCDAMASYMGSGKLSIVETPGNKTITSSDILSYKRGSIFDTNEDGVVDTNGLTSATFNSEYDNGNVSGATTVTLATSQQQKMTLTGNITLTFVAPSGPARFTLKVVQGGTGSYMITWPAGTYATGGAAPTLSTAVGSIDILVVYYDGTNYHVGPAILDSQAV